MPLDSLIFPFVLAAYVSTDTPGYHDIVIWPVSSLFLTMPCVNQISEQSVFPSDFLEYTLVQGLVMDLKMSTGKPMCCHLHIHIYIYMCVYIHMHTYVLYTFQAKIFKELCLCTADSNVAWRRLLGDKLMQICVFSLNLSCRS